MTPWRRRLLIGFLGLVALLLVAIAALQTPAARRQVVTYVVDVLRAQGIHATFEGIDYNPLTLRVSATGVRLAPIDRPDVPFFTADRVDAQVPWAIVRGPLRITSLDVRGALVSLTRDAGGQWNLPPSQDRAPRTQPFILPLGRLRLSTFDVGVDDQQNGVRVGITGIEATLDPRLDGSIAGPLRVTGTVDVAVAGRQLRGRAVGGTVAYDGRHVQLDPIDLVVTDAGGTPLTTVRLTGRVADVYDDRKPELDANGRAVGATTARWLSLAEPVEGGVDWTARIEGSFTDILVPFTARSATLSYGGLALSALETSGRYVTDEVTLDRFAANLQGGEVEGRARFGLGEATGKDGTEIVASWRAVPVVPILSFLDLGDYRLAGRSTGEFSGQWRGGDWRTLVARSSSRVDPRGEGGVPIGGRLTFGASDGRYAITSGLRIAGHTRIDARLGGRLARTWSEAGLEGETTAAADDIAALADALAAARVAQLTLPAGLTGPMTFAGRVEGRMARPVLVGSAEAPALVFGAPGATGTLAATVRVDRTALEATVTSLALDGNSATGEVTFGFDNRTIGGRIETSVVDLGRLARPFVPALAGLGLRGAGRVVTSLSGIVGRMRLDNDVALSGVTLAGQAPAALSGRIGVDGTTLLFDEVELRRPEGDAARLDGLYDWARESTDVRASVDHWVVSPLPAGVAAGQALPVSGVIESSRVDLKGRLATLGGTVALHARDVRYDTLALGTAALDTRFEAGRGVVALTLPELGGVVEGNLSLGGDRPFVAFLRLDQADVRRLLPLDDPRLDLLSLGIAMSGVIQGRLGDPDSIIATAEVTRLEGNLDRTAIALAGPARFTYAERRAQAEAFDVRYGSTRLTLTGAIGEALDGVQLRAHGNLADFESALRVAGVAAPFAISGPFTLSIDAAGPMAAPDLRGALTIDGAQASVNNLPPAYDIRGSASFNEGVLSVETLEGRWQGSTLTASARIPARIAAHLLPSRYAASLPPLEGPATVDASFDPLTPMALEPVLSANVLNALRGAASGRVHLETERVDLEAWRGELLLDRLSLSVANVPMEQVRPTRVELADGRIHVRELDWRGGDNRIAALGAVTLAGADGPRFDLAIDGEGDLRVPGAFFPQISTGGRATGSISLSGPVTAPRVDGLVTIENGEMRVREPRLALTELNGNIVLVGDRVQFDNLSGAINGGRLEVGGEVTLAGLDLATANVTATARGVAMEYPDGFRSEMRASLSLTKRADEATALLAGKVTVLRGAYRASLSLLSFTQGGHAIVQGLVGEEPTPLERTRLNVTVRSIEDLVVDNNYGRFEAGLDLRLTGTYTEPALAGRLSLREGGEIYLAGTTYRLEPSTVDFIDPTRIVPELGIVARTRVGGRDIRLNVTGPPDNLALNLTSEDEDLGRADLASLLLTGQTFERTTGSEADAAGALALSLLSGEVLGSAGRAFGLDSLRLTRGDVFDDDFRLDPTLIFQDTDPASRLTISKTINGVVEVIVSQNLRDSGRVTWIVSARPWRRIEVRVVSSDDNDRTYEIRQDLEFGGPSAVERRARVLQRTRAGGPRVQPEVAGLVVDVTPEADRAAVLDRVKLTPGDTFDFFKWQDDRERILTFYRDQGFVEARVNAQRENVNGAGAARRVQLHYVVARGPSTAIRVDGHAVPRAVIDRIREEWADAVYDGFLVDDATRIVREHVAAEGYLRAAVEARVESDPGGLAKTLVVHVDAGPVSVQRDVEFRGRAAVDEGALTAALETAGLSSRVFVAPSDAAAAVRREYQLRGYLDATVKAEALEFSGERAVLPLTIVEGVRYESSALRFEGVAAAPLAEVEEAAAWPAGRPFESGPLLQARGRVDRYYRQRGYNEIVVTPNIALDREKGVASVTFQVKEGPRQVITDLVVVGGENTSRRLIRRALEIKPGDPANLERIYRARKQLYDTGVFQRADVEIVPPGTRDAREAAATARAAAASARAGDPSAAPAPAARPAESSAFPRSGAAQAPVEAPRVIQDGVEKVEALVTLVERRPWRFRWGFLVSDVYDDLNQQRRQQPGATADLQYRNLFGQAATVGAAVRWSRDYQAGRAFITAPRLFRRNVKSSLYLTRSHENLGVLGVEGSPVEADRTILSVEQRVRPLPKLEFSWGGSYERTDLNDYVPIYAPAPIYDVIKAQSLGLYDRRDNPFDATRGWFHGSAIEYGITRADPSLVPAGAPVVAGNQRFLKYSAQQFHYWTVGTGLVFATAVRGGVSTGFGNDLVVTERFLLGGGNTVRGYAEDSLGPRNDAGAVAGGEAVILFNEELRFPIRKWLRGVAFVDAGNVFARPGDIDLGSLKIGAGLGVRLHTPYVVLRLDFALPVSDSTDFSRGRWIFSLGQAF